MSVRSVRQMNDSPDGAPAGAAETAPEPSHSWLAALRARLGLPTQRQRRQYHFRIRHGFTDVSDATFATLWDGEGLTWRDLEDACATTATAREAAA